MTTGNGNRKGNKRDDSIKGFSIQFTIYLLAMIFVLMIIVML
jgi:hypothetical protein